MSNYIVKRIIMNNIFKWGYLQYLAYFSEQIICVLYRNKHEFEKNNKT